MEAIARADWVSMRVPSPARRHERLCSGPHTRQWVILRARSMIVQRGQGSRAGGCTAMPGEVRDPVEEHGPKRKLTTILHADAAGYTRLMREDEEGTHRILQECRR